MNQPRVKYIIQNQTQSHLVQIGEADQAESRRSRIARIDGEIDAAVASGGAEGRRPATRHLEAGRPGPLDHRGLHLPGRRAAVSRPHRQSRPRSLQVRPPLHRTGEVAAPPPPPSLKEPRRRPGAQQRTRIGRAQRGGRRRRSEVAAAHHLRRAWRRRRRRSGDPDGEHQARRELVRSGRRRKQSDLDLKICGLVDF